MEMISLDSHKQMMKANVDHAKREALASIASRVRQDVEAMKEMTVSTDPAFMFATMKGLIRSLELAGVKIG